jgi:ADP-heptose:LPS heptosyltransferase
MKQRVLVIHQGALGDLILSFPALLSLKNERKVSIDLLCSGDLGKIARELGVVEACLPLESGRFSALFCTKMTPPVKRFLTDYDAVILISFSNAIEHFMQENHGGEVHRITPRPPVDEKTHVAIHLMRQFQAKGLLPSPGCFHLFLSEGVSISPDPDVNFSRKEQLVVLHPGAGSKRKRWAVENFVQAATVIQRENLGEVVFLVGPAESELGPVITSAAKGRFRVHSTCDPHHLIALVQQARCLVGHDSGVTHLSAVMGTPTVAIFGPSEPKRWSPMGPATKVLRGTADCIPCFEREAVNCEDPVCLNRVSVNIVLDSLRELTS